MKLIFVIFLLVLTVFSVFSNDTDKNVLSRLAGDFGRYDELKISNSFGIHEKLKENCNNVISISYKSEDPEDHRFIKSLNRNVRDTIEAEFIKFLSKSGNAETAISLDNVVSISSNLLIPPNITITFKKGGGFNVAKGVKLIISKRFFASSTQIFFGEGDIEYRNNIIRLAWYGSDTLAKKNSLGFLIKAVTNLNSHEGGTILLPKNVKLNNDIIPRLNGIVVVDKPIKVMSETDRSNVFFNCHTVPLFFLHETNRPEIKNLDFIFTGNSNTFVKAGSISEFKKKFGIKNYSTLNNEWLYSVIFSFAVDSCKLTNLSFRSAISDSLHCMSYLIVLCGKNGAVEHSQNGIVKNVKMRDFQHGIFANGQKGLIIDSIDANYRNHNPVIVPGHVVYLNKAGNDSNSVQNNENIRISNVIEGSNAYNLDLGTLSIKYTINSVINNVKSLYPEGLIQSIESCENIKFENLSWKGKKGYQPINPIINFPNTNGKRYLHFQNIDLDAGENFITAIEFSGASPNNISDNVFENIIIKSSSYSPARKNIINSRGINNIFRNITYIPSTPRKEGFQSTLFYISPGSLNNSFQGRVIGIHANSSFRSLKGETGHVNIQIE